jgi:hypothetical protein
MICAKMSVALTSDVVVVVLEVAVVAAEVALEIVVVLVVCIEVKLTAFVVRGERVVTDLCFLSSLFFLH